ncbi:MAG: hypothetical protein GY931_20605, partial [Maribacter sp.]|nr:hypothetical protein [Maribacter sp.]
LVLLFTIGGNAQFKKVDKYKVSNGTIISAGDTFELGHGSGQNENYLYITMKPVITDATVYQVEKGLEGRKFQVELIRQLKNPIGGLTGATIIFKIGKTRYLIDIENAIRTKELIFL